MMSRVVWRYIERVCVGHLRVRAAACGCDAGTLLSRAGQAILCRSGARVCDMNVHRSRLEIGLMTASSLEEEGGGEDGTLVDD